MTRKSELDRYQEKAVQFYLDYTEATISTFTKEDATGHATTRTRVDFSDGSVVEFSEVIEDRYAKWDAAVTVGYRNDFFPGWDKYLS